MEYDIIPGKYRHYKGRDYQVYGSVLHSETDKTLVLYRPLYGRGDLWVRPAELFYDSVCVNGEDVPRFDLLDKADPTVDSVLFSRD